MLIIETFETSGATGTGMQRVHVGGKENTTRKSNNPISLQN